MPLAAAPPISPGASTGEACPLCGTPLHREQEWCLSCGAAARTRLAASPNWKGLIVALAVVVVLALGVLAGALVKLAGDSGSTTPAITRTVTTAATLTSTGASTAPSSVLPGAGAGGTSTPRTTTPGTTPGKLGTSAPRAGATAPSLKHGPTASTPSSTPSRKLDAKAREEIVRKVSERLGKLGLAKAVPSTGSG